MRTDTKTLKTTFTYNSMGLIIMDLIIIYIANFHCVFMIRK